MYLLPGRIFLMIRLISILQYRCINSCIDRVANGVTLTMTIRGESDVPGKDFLESWIQALSWNRGMHFIPESLASSLSIVEFVPIVFIPNKSFLSLSHIASKVSPFHPFRPGSSQFKKVIFWGFWWYVSNPRLTVDRDRPIQNKIPQEYRAKADWGWIQI